MTNPLVNWPPMKISPNGVEHAIRLADESEFFPWRLFIQHGERWMWRGCVSDKSVKDWPDVTVSLSREGEK